MQRTCRKTVIISGAGGYFGSIACKYFQEAGWQVLKAARHDEKVPFDLDKPEDVAANILDQPVDLFIHAAAAHEVKCREQPYRSIFFNVIGTKAALDFCVRNHVTKFVYLSTFHVFGCPKGILNEDIHPVPNNDYGLSHLQAEQYVEMYTREGKIDGMIIRPSNFFGIPAELDTFNRWTLVPLAFCREAVENGEIRLKTPGFQKRNFIDVIDICKVIEQFVHTSKPISLLHIPGPDTITIKELAQIVGDAMKLLGYNIRLHIPAGDNSETSFSYESLHINEFYTPAQHINEFILKMCQYLITQKI